ncbi:hypothetical protein GCM10010112_55870 [Actinoplanes lobatus]|uniref:Transposase n=1 Tax=Actinoplanes lobatus TaxID=113568 RepID=A0ABQ4AW93_9ACTN|nr:hypothetical protein GCM10010112_55870 [Actinoplanes lobatus]GIE45247.1 hypothetical protein Alo02nite_81450 [Actinoplanes lobatus]
MGGSWADGNTLSLLEELVLTSPEGGVLRNNNFRRRTFDRAAESVGLKGLTHMSCATPPRATPGRESGAGGTRTRDRGIMRSKTQLDLPAQTPVDLRKRLP